MSLAGIWELLRPALLFALGAAGATLNLAAALDRRGRGNYTDFQNDRRNDGDTGCSNEAAERARRRLRARLAHADGLPPTDWRRAGRDTAPVRHKLGGTTGFWLVPSRGRA